MPEPADILALQEGTTADNATTLKLALRRVENKLVLMWAHTADGFLWECRNGTWVPLPEAGDQYFIGVVIDTGVESWGNFPAGYLIIQGRGRVTHKVFLPGIQHLYIGDAAEIVRLVLELISSESVIEAFTGDETFEDRLANAGFTRY